MIQAADFAKTLHLTELSPSTKTEWDIRTTDLNRPGMQFCGFYEYFAFERPQVIGKVEMTYLESLEPEARRQMLKEYFSYDLPCVVICRGMTPPEDLLQAAAARDIAVYQTDMVTTKFTFTAINYLNRCLAPRVTRHGVLVEIYGEGILINGDSGIGKSETAIELVKRGHRLIADDAVEIKKVSPHELVGSAPPVLKHYIELRGIGVINVAKLFGMGAVKESSNIDLIINMVPWRDGEAYDRLGMETQYTEILDVKVPSITVPITPGRNLAVIFEVAAMNNRQKRMGYNAAVEFTEQMSKYFTSRNDD